jgi:hypothetical protein
MGNDSLDNAVVDTSLRVKGADRLRLSMPRSCRIWSGQHQCLRVIAEKAADAIRGRAPVERAQFSGVRSPLFLAHR